MTQKRLTDYDGREKRAREDVEEVVESGDVWLVKSESGSVYHVDPDEETCDCPDHQYRDARCKHIRSVEQRMDDDGDETETSELMSIEETGERGLVDDPDEDEDDDTDWEDYDGSAWEYSTDHLDDEQRRKLRERVVSPAHESLDPIDAVLLLDKDAVVDRCPDVDYSEVTEMHRRFGDVDRGKTASRRQVKEMWQLKKPQPSRLLHRFGNTENIEAASQTELEDVDGIGPATAERIVDENVDYRATTGVDTVVADSEALEERPEVGDYVCVSARPNDDEWIGEVVKSSEWNGHEEVWVEYDEEQYLIFSRRGDEAWTGDTGNGCVAMDVYPVAER